MPPNYSSQTKTLTQLLHSQSLTPNQLQQIHTQLLIQTPSLTPPINLFNSLISAYASSSIPTNAFTFFKSHTHPSNFANSFTFQSLLKSSSKCRSIAQTTQLHSMILKLGFIHQIQIQNALIKCYIVCGLLVPARYMFGEMPKRDTVSYNTMISGYFELGDMGSAKELFGCVPNPNKITWTAMITGFCNSGDISSARRHFDEMPEKDLVSWNAMVSGYVHNQQPIQALELFSRMQLERFRPNRVTVVGVLAACASLGALDAGKWVHVYVGNNKFRLDPFIGSALIDMYAKCGAVEFALDVFGSLKERNTCTWNAMINGLALNGHAVRALGIFGRMQLERNVRPDDVTFVGVLMACSHGGFLEEGRKHFYCTTERYGVSLILEHYACMVDLLCRCGFLKEAEDILRQMPMKPDVVVWRALLGGCKLHKNIELAEKVVSEMEAHGSGDYVLLSNLYASVGRWKEVERVRRIMKSKGIKKKTPGCSSIEISNTIHEFISGDKSHPRYDDICDELEELYMRMSKEGYHAETTEVLYDIDEEEKEQALGHHSEKLAIGLGLISTAPGTTLRIVKNLRVCTDCHSATKLISKICKREIVVRDRVRFHHFKDGGRVIPCDFIGVMKTQQPVYLKGEIVSNHDELMSNFFAQPDALAYGKTPEQLLSEKVPNHLIPHKTFSGNRPSLSLLLPSLSAYNIGQLLAIYEHRIAVEGFIWGINSFDQWGVELGKSLASQVRKQLNLSRTKGEPIKGFNFSTTTLLTRYLEAESGIPADSSTLLLKM